MDENSGNRTLHGGVFFLLVNQSVILEVRGSQYEGQKVSDLRRAILEFLLCGLYSGVDRNVGKQRLYVERYHDLVV